MPQLDAKSHKAPVDMWCWPCNECLHVLIANLSSTCFALQHSLTSMGQSQGTPGPSVLDHLPAGSNRGTCLEGYLFAKAEVDKRQQNLASQQMPTAGDRGGAAPLPAVIGEKDFLFENGHDGVRIRRRILEHVDASEEGMDWEEIEADIPFSPIEDWEMLDGALGECLCPRYQLYKEIFADCASCGCAHDQTETALSPEADNSSSSSRLSVVNQDCARKCAAEVFTSHMRELLSLVSCNLSLQADSSTHSVN